MSSRQNASLFRAMLTKSDPAITKLASQTRALIIEVLPEVYEVVWERQRTAGYGTGPKKLTEHFCWIAPAKAHVSLGFNYGAELPDPAKLLEGTGKLFRHVKLTSPEDLAQPALRKLLKTATRHRVPPPQ